MKYAIKAHPTLLKHVQEIFGEGIVKGAWVANYYHDGNEEYTRENLEDDFDRIDIETFGDVGYDANNIVLELYNGKLIYFQNSEWASFGLFKEEYVKID